VSRRPGWSRLWRHSYRLGFRWLVREARRGWPARRVGFARLVVPLDPRRYYELGRIADEEFDGRCLDVSSPKLLPSLLRAEGVGDWVCVDLHEPEIEAWRTIDPMLALEVADATSLPFSDASFDHCVCVSVIEHIPNDGPAAALNEIWRVLRPGGALHLTTDVSAHPRDVYVETRLYGEASLQDDRGVFFKRDRSPDEVDELVGRHPWLVSRREYAAFANPRIETWFNGHVPWSYVVGPFLRFVCPRGIRTAADPALVEKAGEGIVYLRLVKPPSPGRGVSAGREGSASSPRADGGE
jgi:SAM-dependent methyltransferase